MKKPGIIPAEKILLYALAAIYAAAFVIVPLAAAHNYTLPGSDAVGSAGYAWQVVTGIREGKLSWLDATPCRAVYLADIDYPGGRMPLNSMAQSFEIVMTMVFNNPVAGTWAAVIAYMAINAFCLYFFMRKTLNVNFYVALFFSVIVNFFPYLYYKTEHLGLMLFGHNLVMFYFLLRLIDAPRLKYALLATLFFAVSVLVNVQGTYFAVLAAAPAFAAIFIYRAAAKEKGWMKKAAVFWGLFLVLSAALFYVSPYGGLRQRYFRGNADMIKKYLLPERAPGEIRVWKAKPYLLATPTAENLLFGKVTGKFFMKNWGYREKAIYLGIILCVICAFFVFKLGKTIFSCIKKSGYSAHNGALLFTAAAFLSALLWVAAPSLHLDSLLYAMNKSARVYSRAMVIALPLWAALNAYLFTLALEKKIIGKYAAAALFVLVALDTLPNSYKPLCVNMEKEPPEYVALANAAPKGSVVMDYLGNYGGACGEYGHIFYKHLIPGVNQLDSRITGYLWGSELHGVMKTSGVNYLILTKENRELGITPEKAAAFVKKYKLRVIYENARSYVAAL